ncbi:unnamed protein product [Parnassius apollo]|uniref:(apollo) hypothetical protein n=1 Tax=Parnassius apollo TaxID=110799 RepID=A0A8S3XPZ1_PARAO|nr:unnamed protein product [Parnassius apollo]
MSDKCKKPVFSHPEKLMASKKKTITKGTKDLSRAPIGTDNNATDQMTPQTMSNNPLTPTDLGMVEHHGKLPAEECGGKDELEPNTQEPFTISHNLDEATTSSAVLAKSGSNLLRFREQIRHAKAVESKETLDPRQKQKTPWSLMLKARTPTPP